MEPTEKLPPYSFLIRWSEEDKEFVASFLELPELSGLAPTIREAIKEAQVALSAWLSAAKASSLEIPEPSMDRPCMILDGRFAGEEPTLFDDIPEDFVSEIESKTTSASIPFELEREKQAQT